MGESLGCTGTSTVVIFCGNLRDLRFTPLLWSKIGVFGAFFRHTLNQFRPKFGKNNDFARFFLKTDQCLPPLPTKDFCDRFITTPSLQRIFRLKPSLFLINYHCLIFHRSEQKDRLFFP